MDFLYNKLKRQKKAPAVGGVVKPAKGGAAASSSSHAAVAVGTSSGSQQHADVGRAAGQVGHCGGHSCCCSHGRRSECSEAAVGPSRSAGLCACCQLGADSGCGAGSAGAQLETHLPLATHSYTISCILFSACAIYNLDTCVIIRFSKLHY